MPDRKPYRLADLSHMLPMPDRGGQLFPQTEEGLPIDPEHPFYRVLIVDHDIIPVESSSASRADPPPAAAGAPAGRAKGRDSRSGSRPAAE